MKWFYADKNDQQIEVDESELDELIESGTVSGSTLVWNESMSDWKPASSVFSDRWDAATEPPSITPYQQEEALRSSPGAAKAAPGADGICICAMVFGILGIVSCVPIFGLVGVICGHIGRKRALENPVANSNASFALTGLITGYIGIAIGLIVIIFYAAFIGIAIASESTGL